MKIIIKESNLDRIAAEIKEAEGRATARTITAREILTAAESVTRHLNIPKKAMVGVAASVDLCAQDFPRAYKYTPESTHFCMVYTPSGWALVGVGRSNTRSKNHAVEFKFTDAAREAIIARASVMGAWEI